MNQNYQNQNDQNICNNNKSIEIDFHIFTNARMEYENTRIHSNYQIV